MVFSINIMRRAKWTSGEQKIKYNSNLESIESSSFLTQSRMASIIEPIHSTSWNNLAYDRITIPDRNLPISAAVINIRGIPTRPKNTVNNRPGLVAGVTWSYPEIL